MPTRQLGPEVLAPDSGDSSSAYTQNHNLMLAPTYTLCHLLHDLHSQGQQLPLPVSNPVHRLLAHLCKVPPWFPSFPCPITFNGSLLPVGSNLSPEAQLLATVLFAVSCPCVPRQPLQPDLLPQTILPGPDLTPNSSVELPCNTVPSLSSFSLPGTCSQTVTPDPFYTRTCRLLTSCSPQAISGMYHCSLFIQCWGQT